MGYEVTPEDIKRESEIDRSQSIIHVTGRKLPPNPTQSQRNRLHGPPQIP